MLRFLAAISFGVTVGAVIGSLVTGDPRYTVLWSVLLGVSFLLGFGSLFTGRGIRRTDGTGEICLARVERVTRLNAAPGSPMSLDLTVAPARRPAYTVMHPGSTADIRPGSVIVVEVLTPKAPNVVIVDSPSSAWERKRAAEELRTGSERTIPLMAQPWSGAPASAEAAPSRPGRSAGAVIGSIAAVVVFAVAAGATLVPAYPTIARGIAAITSGDPGAAGVVEGTRHADIVAALIDEVGEDRFISIAFYDGYALATAPASPGSLKIDDYQYRYDRAEHQGPTLIQPQTPEAELFSASDVDFTDVRGLVAAAKEHSGITEPASVIVIFSRTMIADDTGSRPVEARVLLDSPYEDATVVFDAASGELRP